MGEAWVSRRPSKKLYACPGFVDIHTHPSLGPRAPDYRAVGFTDWLDACVPWEEVGFRDSDNTGPNRQPFLIELGNDRRFFELFAKSKWSEASSLLRDILTTTGASGIKLVNPGGVFSHRCGVRLQGWNSSIPGYDLNPRRIVEGFIAIKGDRHLQLHMTGIGRPGNYRVVDEIRDLLPYLHLSHLQYYCYGGASWKDLSSQAEYVLQYVEHFDIGAVFFGDTLLFSWDEPFMNDLSREVRSSSFAPIPYTYKPHRFVNALQFVVGLELALSGKGCISCDFPNGGSVSNYPGFMRMLVDVEFRKKVLEGIHPLAISPKRSKIMSMPSMTMTQAVNLFSIRPRIYLGLPTTIREAKECVVFNDKCEVVYVGPLVFDTSREGLRE